MYREPIELRLPRRPYAPARPTTAPTLAVDEAFAAVEDSDLRREAGHTAGAETETASLSRVLREQLASLDTQRRHLARLLDDLGA